MQNTFDAIVIGSGISAAGQLKSFVKKELRPWYWKEGEM